MGVGEGWQVTQGCLLGLRRPLALKTCDGYMKKSHTCYVGNTHGFVSGLRYSC